MRRTAAMLLGTVLAATALSASQAAPVNVQALVETYAAGGYDEAVRKAAALPDLGPFRLRFVQDIPAWIASDPALSDRRRAAAAAFLLELTHARLESDWGRFSDLIEWICVDLRTNAAPAAFELAWHRASLALAGRARARLWLLGEQPLLPHQPPRKRPPPKVENPSPRHLMHALERFPDDPQLRLGQVVAWLWGRDSEPTRNLPPRAAGPGIRPRASQLEALPALEPLTGVPSIAAEAWLRIGLVRFTAGDAERAIHAFQQADQHAPDAATRYVALVSIARAHEAAQRSADAIRHYEEALKVLPGAESASIALASLRFTTADRDAAIAMMDRTFAASPPVDPWRLAGYGSFVNWQRLRDAMRVAVGTQAFESVPVSIGH